MFRLINKFIFLTVLLILSILLYLTFIGVNTNKFNNIVKNKLLEFNPNYILEIKDINFKLYPTKLKLNISSKNVIIGLSNQKLKLKNISADVSIKSYFKGTYPVNNVKAETDVIDVKKLLKIVRNFKDNFQLMILMKSIESGNSKIFVNINLDERGKIKKNYFLKGFIKDLKISLLNDEYLDTNFNFTVNPNSIDISDANILFQKIKLNSDIIKIIYKKNNFFNIDGNIKNEAVSINISDLENIFKLKLKNIRNKKVRFLSNNKFNFDMSSKLKISNFELNSNLDINEIVYKVDYELLKKVLGINNNLKIIDQKLNIKLKGNKKNKILSKIEIKGSGNYLIENKIDKFNFNFSKEKDIYRIISNIEILKNTLDLDILNYKKNKDRRAVLNVEFSLNKNNSINVEKFTFKEEQNIFSISNLNINENLQINDLKMARLSFLNSNNIKNEIKLFNNNKEYFLTGSVFDGSKIINELTKNTRNEKNNFLYKIKNFKINLDKLYIDSENTVNNVEGTGEFAKGQISELKLISYFNNKEKLIVNISSKNNQKNTFLTTKHPKPLIKRYKFIKGFEDGILDFQSVTKNNISSSVLIIDNFKVKEVPVLAKILTLASLQGIADLLTGEGIRFTDFEMKYLEAKNLITIDEIYAIGPAISLMMDGYIEKDKLVSLRGTLVPATTINRSISSIPLIGDILVGKKVGEGVFGVSFKIKGPPNDLKTTVNPIKTLTPRFITRTLEKLKN